MNTPLRLLIIEDSESDAGLIARRLQKAGYDLEYDRVETAEEMKAGLAKQNWDLIIADYNLPGFSGRKALEIFKEDGRDIPFIVVSAAIGEDKAVALMKAGAHDYVMKDNLARLVPAVERELREAAGRRERRRAEDELVKSEATLSTILKGSPTGIGLVVDRVIQWVNKRFLELTGYSQEELIGRSARMLYVSEAEFKRVGDVKYPQIISDGWGQVDTQWQHKDGSLIEVHLSSAALDPGNLSAGVVFTAMDITARKQAEEELRESEAILRTVLKGSSSGIGLVVHRVFQWVNDKLLHLTGYTREELIGQKSRMLYFSETEYKLVGRVTGAQIEANGWAEVETRWRRKDGSSMEIYVNTSAVEPGNLSAGVVFTAMDITARKQAEEARRATQERLELALKGGGLGTWDWNIKTGVVAFNQRWAEMLGYHLDELEPHFNSWTKLVHPEDLPAAMAALNAHLEGKTPLYENEHRLCHKSGEWVWVLDKGRVIERDAEGKPVRACGTHLDITERKKAEEALRESELFFRSLFENMLNGFAYHKMSFKDNKPQDYVFLEVNEAFETLTGLRGVVGKKISEVIPGLHESTPELLEIYGRVALTGKPEKFEIYVEPLKLWFSISVYSPKKEYFVTVFEQITARKQAEASLRESEERFRLVFEKAPIGIMHYDQTGTITNCNEKFAEIIGAPKERFIGFNLIRQARDDQMRKAVIASFNGEVGYYEGDYLSVTGSKSTPVRAIFQPITSPEGIISGGITIFEDITERQRATSDLKLKERLLDSASDSIFLFDLEGNFLYMNEAAYITRWYTKEELLSLGAWALDTPEAAVYQDNILGELWANGELIFESEHRRKDGSVMPVEIFARVLVVEGRELILSVVRDITERRQAEEALRRSRETLRVLLDATPAAVMLLDPQYTILAANRVVADRLGKPITKLVGTEIFGHLPPEIARSRKDRLDEIKRSGNPAIFEDIRGDHSFENYVHPIVSITGEMTGLTVLSMDITDRKRAEETLLLDEARLEALVNLSQMSGASLEALAHFALEEGVRLTKSKIGYLAFLNEDETVLTMYAWSRHAMEQCAVSDKPIEYPLATTGQWGEAVRQRRPIIINDFAAPHPDKKGYPPGHIEVLRHMNLPVFDGRHIVAVAGVGNKEEPYNESDVRQLTLLMDGMWKLVQRNQAETALKESVIQLHRTLDSTAIALATTVEMRDPYTAGHQKGVALLACAIAEEMGFSADQLEGLRVMGLLHDIGKIAVPAEILSRPGKISAMEFNIIKVHSQVGYDIIKDIEFPWPVAQGILQHHERINGSGYPQGLKDDKIIPEAKILAVADVVEAMSAHRPYRPSLGIDRALEEITKNKGTLYDAEAVEACVRLFTEKGFRFHA